MKDSAPTVSILCITYNHGNYIRQAIESFFLQKLDGNFEIIIHDDASTDDTVQIIKDYQKTHPGVITLLEEKENQFSKGDLGFMEKVYRSARGKYLAWCEGDDYWSDPSKIHSQVDYLEHHPQATVCFHPVEILNSESKAAPTLYPLFDGTKFTLERLLRENYIQTNSVMYRRQANYHNKVPSDIVPLDWYMHIFHATKGDIGFINKPMSVYRRHANGVWWQSPGQEIVFWEKRAIPHLLMYQKVMQLLSKDDKSLRQIRVTTKKTLGDILRVCVKQKGSELARRIVQAFPDLVAEYLLDVQESADELYVSLLSANEKMKVLANLETTNKGYSAEIDRLREELDTFHKKLHNPVTLYANLILNRFKH